MTGTCSKEEWDRWGEKVSHCRTCGAVLTPEFRQEDYLRETIESPLTLALLRIFVESDGPLTLSQLLLKIYGPRKRCWPKSAANCIYNAIYDIRRLLRPEFQLPGKRGVGYWWNSNEAK